jgi:hypothetical protein
MVSILCTLALDFLYEEDFLQSNLLQRGGNRPQEEKRGSSCGILLLFGGGCSGENCSGDIRISVERGISRRANCLVFAPAVFKIRRAPGFLLRRYSIHTEHPMGVLLCGILLLEEIQG